MVITARMVKREQPDAKICFVGPCSAKKLEANRRSVRSYVDFVLTFEELQGMFDAKDVDFATIESAPEGGFHEGSAAGRGFAVSGGVAAAVAEVFAELAPDRNVPMEFASGLKDCKKMLMMAKAGKRDGYLLEGMACPGGCVAGAGTIRPVKNAAAGIQTYMSKASVKGALDSDLLHKLPEVEAAGQGIEGVK